MITRITEHNDKLYDALFADISETITGLSITKLEEYFGNLQTIGAYVKDHADKAYFLRLPVDEDMITINANARSIVLPENYRRNGIAVAGDTFAETLWFKIDRYYDLQDLSLTYIYIFWELPDKTKGYSTPAFTDINSEAGQLIFSWTIPDLLTANAGNIKFYVSFQVRDTNTYVFNTLAQTAKINSTLEAKFDTEGLRPDLTSVNDILSRLRNTTSVGRISVARPRFSEITSSANVLDKLLNNATTTTIVVSAYSSDNDATITYTLYKNGVEVNNIEPEDVYIKTLDTIANPDKIYYTSAGTALDNVADLSNAYEHGKAYVISVRDSYQCQAIAERTVQIGEGEPQEGKSAPAYSTVWLWEAPTPFTITNTSVVFENNPDGIITSAADNDKDIIITWPNNTKESPQQQAATYEAVITIDAVPGGSSIGPATVNSATAVGGKSTHSVGNPFMDSANQAILGQSNVNVVFTKTLNKETIPAAGDDPIRVVLPIQSAALAYTATGVTFSNNKVFTGDVVTVTLDTTDCNSAQEYWYCWQKRSGTDTWVDIGNLAKLTISGNSLNFSDSFGNSGVYRLKIVAKYYKDSKETYTTNTISVGSFNG